MHINFYARPLLSAEISRRYRSSTPSLIYAPSYRCQRDFILLRTPLRMRTDEHVNISGVLVLLFIFTMRFTLGVFFSAQAGKNAALIWHFEKIAVRPIRPLPIRHSLKLFINSSLSRLLLSAILIFLLEINKMPCSKSRDT